MACPNPAAKTFSGVGELDHTFALKAAHSGVPVGSCQPIRAAVGWLNGCSGCPL